MGTPSPEAVTAHRLARYHPRILEVADAREIARELERTGCEPEGVGIMTRKGRTVLVRLDHISLKAAPLLKQEMLAVGADSAHARGIADHSVAETEAVLLATPGQYRRVVEKLLRQPFQLREVGHAIETALARYGSHRLPVLRGMHRAIPLGRGTGVLGVINVTPDSFSDGGKFLEPDRAVERAAEIETEGARMVDLGAESTRPGAGEITAEQEWARLGPVLGRLHAVTKIPISVDTRHAEVARRAIDAGADLINDVSGLRDPEMRRLLARTGAPAILMHMRGTPATMQADTAYTDVRGEVYAALAEGILTAVSDGVATEQLLVDPGLGFGKAAEHNLEILRHLGEFRSLGRPLVVGASRKSFLGLALGGAAESDRLEAGIAAAVLSARAGAALVRTHDVGPTVRALRLVDAVLGGSLAPGPEARPAEWD